MSQELQMKVADFFRRYQIPATTAFKGDLAITDHEAYEKLRPEIREHANEIKATLVAMYEGVRK